MHTSYIAAIAVGAIACITDWRSRRIPNALTFGSALAALVFHAASGGASGCATAAAGWAAGAAIFFLPFALGGLGAGDVKLLAALGAWLGPEAAVWIALYAGLAGGLLALAVAVGHGYLRTALANVWKLLCHWRAAGAVPLDTLTLATSAGPHLAYAFPIFVGMSVTLWLH